MTAHNRAPVQDAYGFVAGIVLDGIRAAHGNPSNVQVQLVIGRAAERLERRDFEITQRTIREIRARMRDAWADRPAGCVQLKLDLAP
jgi:hypothetical protein